jgi:hypothetical protein
MTLMAADDDERVRSVIRELSGPWRSQPGLCQSGLATKDEISAFTASANRPDISGDGARHARMAGGPPKRTMPIEQARQFISNLVRMWMDTLK